MYVVDELALELERCAFCKARPGVWCRRHAHDDPEHRRPPTGRASYLHDARTRRLYEFSRQQYAEGERGGIYSLAWSLERALKSVNPAQLYAVSALIEWVEERAEAARAAV